MAVDASDRPDDRFGYSVYAGVLFASQEQQAAVQRLRAQISPRRAMLPAHVTVKGTFCGIESLDEVKRLFGEVAAQSVPFEVQIAGSDLHVVKDATSHAVVKGPALVGLYEALTAAVGPACIDAYGYDLGGYQPHLTLWQECPPENEALAQRLARGLHLGSGFSAGSVALVGRIGPAHGGKFATIQSFRLGGRLGGGARR